MQVDEPRLYDLLPAVHRVRDAAIGGPLQALLAVVQSEADRLEADIAQLYDDWFIETCEEWVVPYIGDLLGVAGISPVRDASFSQRGFVANTLAYRRRKGTAVVLERLGRDVTGWPTRAVEFFELLSTTENLNHVRLGAGGTARLRDATALLGVGGPFDPTAHTGEVRHIDNGRGRYNVPDVGVYLWRLQAYPLDRTTAPLLAGSYRFDPLGADRPLFNRPRTEADPDDPTVPLGVPEPLSRRILRDELTSDPLELRYLDPADPVFAIWTGGSAIDATRIGICDLSVPGRAVPAGKDVAVDPVLGRFAFASGFVPADPVEASWAYGFPAEIGGGPYDRQAAAAAAIGDPSAVSWQIGVTRDPPAGSTELVGTLGEAVSALGALASPPELSVIAVMDSRTYDESLILSIPAGTRLVILAADWPQVRDPVSGLLTRPPGHVVASGLRPAIVGNLAITGEVATGDAPPGELVLDGVAISGNVEVTKGALGLLALSNCTVRPGAGTLSVEPGTGPADRNTDLEITLSRTICAAVRAHPFIRQLSVTDTILDGDGTPALADSGPGDHGASLRISTSTVFGELRPRSLYASSTLCTDHVDVERRQEGCVRYSYVTVDSIVPRRFRCQPGSAAEAQRVVPTFVSADIRDPAYAQLAVSTPPEILTGAEDAGEIGAYNLLAATHRVTDLRQRIDEYLRFGLEAGVLFAT
jgi:hypothetical protein